MIIHNERNALLTEFGIETLKDRYLLPSEQDNPQLLFKRVAEANSDDQEHAQRMYDYMSLHWFMGATPVLSNSGTDRGYPISCYLMNVDDSMLSINEKWYESVWLGSGGGGIGVCYSDVRAIGEKVGERGESSGVIPFVRVVDSLTLAVSQGDLRRGAGAVYLDVRHPEIEEFLEIRKPTGDFNRKSLNIHHAVVVPDEFMYAVERNGDWALIDPHSGLKHKEVNARDLFQSILECRMQTGEPYIMYEGNVNKHLPAVYKALGLKVKQSNLCSEILLATGLDHLGKDRTAVCCLSSVNFEYFNEWKDHPTFVEDCMRFLDNVLTNFINKTEGVAGMEAVRYSAMRERAVALGGMGFHSFLQKNGVPFSSVMAKSWNKKMWSLLRTKVDEANYNLAMEKGECPDSIDARKIDPSIAPVRFSHALAVAPTATISIIAGGCSPCIEPWNTNYFTQKTTTGNKPVKNKYLERDLRKLGLDTPEIWEQILENGGSVAKLDVPDWIKEVYETSTEINNVSIIDMAADRAPFIDQGQSVNMFLEPDIHKWDLFMLHYRAWKAGVKTLYYLRSRSMRRAAVVGSVADDNTKDHTVVNASLTDYSECLSCQ